MADGMFDDLLPAKPAAEKPSAPQASSMFADLVPGEAPRAAIPNAPLGEVGHVTELAPVVVRPDAAQTERSWGEALGDTATRVRQGLNNVVGGVLGAPVNILNAASQYGTPMRAADTISRRIAGVPSDLIPQPAAVQGTRAELARNNAVEQEGLSLKAKRQAAEFQQAEGFVDSLGYLARNPSYAGTEAAAQLPQFLQLVPGSVLGTVGAQAVGAGSQNAQQVEADLIAQGMDPREAASRAADTFAASTALNAAVPSAVPGGSAIERLISGQAGRSAARVTASTASRVAVPALGEIATETAQEGADQIIQNIATGRPAGEGVGQAAALGTLIGAPGGVLSGAVDVLRAPSVASVAAEAAPTTAIDPAILAAGNAALGAAPVAPAAKAAPAAPIAEQDAQAAPTQSTPDIDAMLANLPAILNSLPPEVVDQALGAIAQTPAAPSEPASSPASNADGAAATNNFVQRAAAAMRMQAQERAAQNPAPAVQSPAAPAGSRPAGGDLAIEGRADDQLPAFTADPQELRGEIGWAERGGKLLRARPDFAVDDNDQWAHQMGDAVGRTKWVGQPAPDGSESQFWRNRPDARLTEKQATAALDKAAAGESLRPIEQRFVEYARQTSQEYADARAAALLEVNDYAEADHQDAVRRMREEYQVEIADEDAAEALGLSELVRQAQDAGADEIDVHQAANESDGAYAARLFALTKEPRRGADTRATQEDRGRDAGREPQGQAAAESGEQAPAFGLESPRAEAPREVAPTQGAGLFGAPTARDFTDAVQRSRDDARNGRSGTGRTDMLAGDGELFAGDRPEQASVPDDSLESVQPAGSDLTEISRRMGEADAERLGLRTAVNEALGKVGEKVIFLRGYDGLPERSRLGVQRRAEQRGGKGRTSGLYDPATKTVYLFTDALRTPSRAVWTAAHEIAGHEGLRTLLGDKLDHALGIALQNPTVAAVADAIAAERALRPNQRLLAAEEALAELAAAIRTGNFAEIEGRYAVPVPEGVRERLTRAIESFLRQLKEMVDDIFGRHQFTDEDVRALLENAWQAVNEPANGELGPDIDAVDATAADQTQTPAFRRWFAGSKVVDDNGEPLVVYHGTAADIEAFSKMALGASTKAKSAKGAFFFAKSPVVASGYAMLSESRPALRNEIYKRAAQSEVLSAPMRERLAAASEKFSQQDMLDSQWIDEAGGGVTGANVIPVYLSLQTPLVVEYGGGEYREFSFSAAVQQARDGGHDGVIFRNAEDSAHQSYSEPTDIFAVFDPLQIKSATANRGTFDPSRPSILENVEPDFGSARSVLTEGRLLSVIDAAKAAGIDLAALQTAFTNTDGAAALTALDEILSKLRKPAPMRSTGTKNAVTDAERAAANRDPILREAVKSNEATLYEAMRAVKEDSLAGPEAVARLSRGGAEGISLADEAVLLVYKTELLNKRDAAAKKLADPNASEDAKAVARRAWDEAEASITGVDMAAVNAGTEWGRFGQFRQRMLRADFTFEALERKERARLERPLTQDESATVKAMAEKIAELQAKVDKLQDRVRNAASESAYETTVAQMVRPTRQRRTLSSLRQAADEARARLAANQGVQSRRRQSGAVIGPQLFADYAIIGAYHIANGAATFADWVSAMRADLGDAFDRFKAEHPNIFKAARAELDKPIKADATVAEVMAGIDPANITPKDVRKLIEALVGEGLRGEPAVISAAAKRLSLAEDEVRALFVQTAPRAPQTLTEAQEELRDMRKLVRLQNEIDRLEAGQPKPPRGQTTVDSPEVAARKQELADLRKRLRPVRDPEGRYQEMRGKQIEKRIAELQDRIARGDFAARPRIPRALSEANQRAMFELEKAKYEFLRHQFEDTMRRRTPIGKVFGAVGDTFNLARAMMTSFDLSGILRQGGFITYGHPLRAASSIGPSLRAFASDQAEHRVRSEIESRKNAPLYAKYGLQLTGIGSGPLTQIEEVYASRWLERFPAWLGGGLVRGSGRAYTSFLNKLRADSFDAMAASLGRRAELTDAEGKAIANYINVATGRGKIGVKNENAAQALNTVFFAPKLVASRFQLLAGQPLYGGTPRTRKMIVAEYARFLIGVSIASSLAAFALGEDDDSDKPLIGLDPRSADFGKIRVGNTYLDPLAGLAQVSTFVARLGAGETVSGAGKVKPIRPDYTLTDLRRALGEDVPAHKMGKDGQLPFGSGSAASVIGRFLRTKLAPVPGAIVNTLSGSNLIGEEVTPADAALEMVTPMSFSDIGEVMGEHGIPKGTAMTVLGMLGMGMQHRDGPSPVMLTAAARADVKERLGKLPADQWAEELDALKEEYGPILDGVELAIYKEDGKYGDAGEPRRTADGAPVIEFVRLSDRDTYTANYRRHLESEGMTPAQIERAVEKNSIHHIIPDNVVRAHPLMITARTRGFDLDEPSNLIGLTKERTEATDSGEELGHWTDHPRYDDAVVDELDAVARRLRLKHGSLDDAPESEVIEAIRKVEDSMRKRIEARDVPTKGGRLALREGESRARA